VDGTALLEFSPPPPPLFLKEKNKAPPPPPENLSSFSPLLSPFWVKSKLSPHFFPSFFPPVSPSLKSTTASIPFPPLSLLADFSPPPPRLLLRRKRGRETLWGPSPLPLLEKPGLFGVLGEGGAFFSSRPSPPSPFGEKKEDKEASLSLFFPPLSSPPFPPFEPENRRLFPFSSTPFFFSLLSTGAYTAGGTFVRLVPPFLSLR